MSREKMIKRCATAGLLLAFILSGCSSIVVKSSPPGASVYTKENDSLIGTTPTKVTLVAKNKEIVVRKEGFFSKTVSLSPTDPESVQVHLNVRDKVFLISHPDGADLLVDEVKVGRTPYLIDYDQPYRVFNVTHLGYAPELVTVSDDPEGNVVVNLKRDDSVIVDSKPKNSVVITKDGRNMGPTPVALPATTTQSFVMKKEGYYSSEFTVDPSTESPFIVTLKREPLVTISSNPKGALVIRRGITLGKTPYRQLAESDMTIEIQKEGYKTKEVTISPTTPHNITITLEQKPYITIESNPASAKLYRAGGVELLGETPVEVLVEQDSTFEIHKAGFEVKTFVLSPESSSLVTVPLLPKLASMGKKVIIASTPEGAKVYRPGGAEFVGVTPLEQYVRDERSFELQLSGFKTKYVAITPDSADRVVFVLERGESSMNTAVGDPLLNTPSTF